MNGKAAIVLCASVIAVVATTGEARAELGSMTTVNGAAPPGTAAAMSDLAVMLDTVQADAPAIIVLEPGWPDLTDPTG